MNISVIISSLIAAGGLGFINYSVEDKLGLVDFSKEWKPLILPYMLCWSIFDYAIYLIILHVVRIFPYLKCLSTSPRIAVSLLLTITVVYYITFYCAKPLKERLNSQVVKSRAIDGKPEAVLGSAWNRALSNNKETMVYAFTFDKQPVVSGFLAENSAKTYDEMAINVAPFIDQSEQHSFDDLMKKFTDMKFREKFNIIQHVNFDKSLILVVITKK